ncbi:DUF222 domain-containing protein [Kribbella catacumbae]|uniref:DUF222 domain-containing protein n=1 Tax=Kribbella catacumbae TaxID=460086 RepID=UPI00037DD5E8|nr:DUF222 domain-containing protein [Kribbella catacumbae]
MEIPELRPAWSQTGSELLVTFDTLQAARSALDTYELQIIARIDETGLAKEEGARDTVELLSLRARLNGNDVRRNLALATNLAKYPAVTAALPDPSAGPTTSNTPETPDDTDTEAAADRGGDLPQPPVIHPGQAKAIVAALEKAPTTVPVEDLEAAERIMVEAARHLAPGDLTILGKQILARLDTDGPEPAENDAAERERLRLRRVDNGVQFTGFLANEHAELLQTQIDKLSKPHKTDDGERDPRSRDKRQADALTTILERAAGSTAPGPGVPHITVTIDFDDLRTATTEAHSNARTDERDLKTATTEAHSNARTDERDSEPGCEAGYGDAGSGEAACGGAGCGDADCDGAGSGETVCGDAECGDATRGGAGCGEAECGDAVCGDADCDGGDCDSGRLFGGTGGVGELVFGENLSASAVRLLACDARILPIVLGSDSRPLDVGTEERLVTPAIRRALVKRDKGCVICHAPPWQCHAHHMIHWADGGPTSLANLILACSPHHTAIHHGHWTITITHGAVEVTRPAWADPVRRTLADLTTLKDTAGNPWPQPADNTNTKVSTNTKVNANAKVNPTHEQPNRLPPAASLIPAPTTAMARDSIRSWLTPEATAQLNPWGDSGTPSAGP